MVSAFFILCWLESHGLKAWLLPLGPWFSALIVLQAMKKLPTKQAAALVLRHFHGYTNREIAAAIGVPEQTVASRLAAARKQLQAVLGRR